MAWKCVTDIRRWADEDIENVGRDVLRRTAQQLADACADTLNNLIAHYDRRIALMAGVQAETAKRNERNEKEIVRLREDIRALQDSRAKFSKLEPENALLRMQLLKMGVDVKKEIPDLAQ